MNIYGFDASTGEYGGEWIADESPLEPGVFLIPYYATATPPPELSPNEAAVWDFAEKAWTVKPDYRNTPLYSTETGAEVDAHIGDTPQSLGATELTRPGHWHDWDGSAWAVNTARELAELKAAKFAEITSSYSAEQYSTVQFNGATYPADAASQDNLQKTLTGLAYIGTVPDGFYWLDSSNATQGLSYADLKGLAGAMWMHGWSASQKYAGLMAAVTAASTTEAVAEVSW